jgi:hypothetical protein
VRKLSPVYKESDPKFLVKGKRLRNWIQTGGARQTVRDSTKG